LIADEPVSALDVSIRAQLINLLRDAQVAHKIGMVFVAHDLSVVRQISNRVAVMYLGKIVEEGAAEDVYRNPMHPYTRLLLSAIPTTERLGKPLIGLREIGEAPSPVNIPRGCRFHTRCPFAQEMCKEQSPTLVSVQQASTHFSACLRSAELPGTTAGAGP
jgi:oligopeptide/dipeptide ABC transporter ATP-binding protein